MTKTKHLIDFIKTIASIGLFTLAVLVYRPINTSGANFHSSTTGGDFQITTAFWAPDAPTNLGYNLENASLDDYATPRPNSEVACGGITNLNSVSHHWTDVAAGNPLAKYQRQFDRPTTPPATWEGSEIYSTPYSNFRTFAGTPGIAGTYNSRVRTFIDLNNNNFLDLGEAYSDWSANDCFITYDYTAPSVKIDSPLDSATISGTVPIYATVTDDNPHHYWLVMQTLGGTTVAGPGTVTNTASFTNQLVYNWNTTSLAPGQYIIKLEARDSAGNKSPNSAPVLADPEILGDSLDWITVTVGDNSPPPMPIPQFPTDSDTLRASQLYVDWSDVTDDFSNPVTYDYQLFLFNPDTHPDPDLPIRYGVYNTTASRHPLAGFAPGTPEDTYWWHARACDSVGNCSAWTPAWQFTVDNSAPLSDIVLNEIMYDPVGDDSATMPAGEWVELYNNGDSDIDVAGWYIKDTAANVKTITAAYADNNLNLLDSGETVVPAHGWLVFYFPGLQILNNSGDTVTLYDTLNQTIDTRTYTGSKAEGTTEARIPDGTGEWVDPLPTQGRANIEHQEDLEPMARLWQQEPYTTRFDLFDAINYATASYTLDYTHNDGGGPVTDVLTGTVPITGQQVSVDDLFLGTCSSGGTCTPHLGVDPNSMTLSLTLTGPSIPDHHLTEPLSGGWIE